jgi:hypothetical protein
MVNLKLFSLLLQVRDAFLRSPVTKHGSRSLIKVIRAIDSAMIPRIQARLASDILIMLVNSRLETTSDILIKLVNGKLKTLQSASPSS